MSHATEKIRKIYMKVDAERLRNDIKKVDNLLIKIYEGGTPDEQADAVDDARFYLEPWERMASREVKVKKNMLERMKK